MTKVTRKKRSRDKFIWTKKDRLLITSPDGIVQESNTGRIKGRRLPPWEIVKTTPEQPKEDKDGR
jgi:hypothetical protein